MRLLDLRFPVNVYYTAVRQGQSPQLPSRRRSFVAITRRDYVVRRIALSAAQFELLDGLLRGQSVGDAIAQAVKLESNMDELATSVRNWFQQWAEEGLFLRVEPDG